MKKQILALAVLSLFAVGAQAQQVNVQPGVGNTNANANSQSGALGVAAGNTTSTTVTFNNPGTVDYSGEYKIKQAVPLAIGGPASGPCNGFSAGLGVTVPGFGIVGNMSKVDEGCEERETARIAALMGRMDIANTIIENTEVYQRALKRKQEREAEAKAKKAEVQPVLVTASYNAPTPQEQKVNACNWAKSTGDQILAMRHCN